jgi:hypothetical protein
MNSSSTSASAGDAQRDKSLLDTAWLVLEAAIDLGDHAAVEACRRVIDASLSGAPAPQADLHLILDYFR